MQAANLFLVTIVLALVAYVLGYARSRSLATPLGGIRHLKSLPFTMAPGQHSGAVYRH